MPSELWNGIVVVCDLNEFDMYRLPAPFCPFLPQNHTDCAYRDACEGGFSLKVIPATQSIAKHVRRASRM